MTIANVPNRVPTRKERVLNLLKHPESPDGWVPGPLIDSARIGGQAWHPPPP